MKKISAFLFIIIIFGFLCSANATPVNVALNADVALNGASFFTNGWGGGAVVDPDTVVDGVFLPRETQWDQGPVWWDSHDGLDRYITIDLGEVFSIESFVVQADDNDAYKLSFWDLSTSSWQLAWDVPNYDSFGWGIQTRPDPANDAERYVLASNIVTNSLKFEGNMDNSDLYFSVSEIQAYGTPVPEPTTMLLLGLGLAGLAGVNRKKIKK